MKDTDPDVELLARIGNNEPAAVNEMVTRKLPRLLALASRILGDADEAKDVAQESFLRHCRLAPGTGRQVGNHFSIGPVNPDNTVARSP